MLYLVTDWIDDVAEDVTQKEIKRRDMDESEES